MKELLKKRKINKKSLPADRQSGAAMLVFIVFFLFISLAIIFGLVSPSIREFKNANMNLDSKKSFFLAESGLEDAFYRLSKNKQIGENETIILNSNPVNTTITTLLGNLKEIVSFADVSSYQRKISLTAQAGDGVVFKYGTQAGQGGFVFHNNSYVTGSVYSNGNIVGSNGAYITGDAFVAGATGSISNMRIGYGGTGDANSHNITDSTITGNIYCQTGSGNNKPCDTSKDDPLAQDLPISDDNISKWKADATAGGTTNGNVIISTPTTIGPRKIIGNLTIDSTLTIANTIYVTGNIIINIGKTVKLDSSYGATSGIIISDGYIIINNNVIFEDSGTAGSYILFLSNSTCDASISGSPCNGNNATEVSNNSTISIVNAQKGTVYFSNNARVKEAVGNKIELKQNVGISYGSGLINVNFTSGPSGSWGIEGWKEK
ncbi:MAG: hypothetical protein AAB493_00520 [Patescibacteria group bacterium]